MTFIFIHGLGQDAESWQEAVIYMNQPPKMTCQIECPDLVKMLRGNAFTYENLYLYFSEYCNKIPGKLNLCGLSLGGILAMNYAIDFPDKVNSLILVGAQYKMPKALLKIQNVIFRVIPKRFFAEGGFQKKEYTQLIDSMIDLNFENDLKGINCPTLVVCGNADKVNKKAALFLAQAIPNASFSLIEKAGHEVNTSNPENLVATIKVFYQKMTRKEEHRLMSTKKSSGEM